MRLRSVIFWCHLTAAAFAGLVILTLCFSGAMLAFQGQICSWADRSARHPGMPADSAGRLSLHDTLASASRGQPALLITSMALSRDPGDSIDLTTVDRKTWCVNPYTGGMRQAGTPRLNAFFLAMARLHVRFPFGGGIVAAANVVFLFLIASGLYLWWPRTWNWRTVRPSIWFVSGARGRARDWNWHNVTAIWLFPILAVLAGTGVVMSYRPVNALMFRLRGDHLPNPSAARRPLNPTLKQPVPPSDAPSLEDFVAQVEHGYPGWKQIVVVFQPQLAPGASAVRGRLYPQRLAAYVTMPHPWPVFANEMVSRDPATGALQHKDSYRSLSPGWRTRRWVRLLHSGEAFGWPGQLAACLACFGGCFLVYTGYAMALRRLFGRIRRHAL